MTVLKGKSACGGIAVGRLQFYRRAAHGAERRRVEDAEAEVRRFEQARGQAVAQLAALFLKASKEVGEENSLLFQIHQMMLEDLDYCEAVTGRIRGEQVNAEYAVEETARQFAAMFAEMDDAYMQGRAADVRDVSNRVVSILSGRRDAGLQSDGPVIVAADDLAPSETVQLDKSKVLAFVTAQGSVSSHTAILARTMGIPAVVAAGGALDAGLDGKEAVVDGFTGEIFIEPDAETRGRLLQKARRDQADHARLEAYRGMPTRTRSGQGVLLYANIGSPDDLDAALQNDAEGIGLFRSEFLYLERDGYPTQEQQFEAYRQVVRRMAGKRVVIRTLDIGADKQIGYFDLPAEENPALGLRAIRLCLTRPELLRTQLRALYRASAFGKLAVMFPMITSVDEVRRAKQMAADVQAELKREGIPFAPDVEIGIMIETPAAAVISDMLAKEVDFFSIGTNDLTQYTLAIDRQNESLAAFCDPRHAAVLRLIEYTVKSAHDAGIWVGICGELGADESLTEAFLRMGVDELSVSPPAILSLRAKIRES